MLLRKTVLLFGFSTYSAFLSNHEISSLICRESLSWTKLIFTECKCFYYVRAEQMKFDVTFIANEIKFISVSFQLPMHKMVNKLRWKRSETDFAPFLLIALTTWKVWVYIFEFTFAVAFFMSLIFCWSLQLAVIMSEWAMQDVSE